MDKEKVKKQRKKEEQTKKVPSFPIVDVSQSEYGLVTLGVALIILGFLSLTPIIQYTFLSSSADFMIGIGIVAIVVGLILKVKRKDK